MTHYCQSGRGKMTHIAGWKGEDDTHCQGERGKMTHYCQSGRRKMTHTVMVEGGNAV